ncbi:quercetin 2,3-dioxygenase [Neosynechococcus sphagnicola sy1]|uniref:Quercetin 2,3-dioxygenase n=1 Tax=Neosynechococcus sphagnicola sy1 TaxID=1497020 RepID=A0A098TMH2_9CYAN|nr:pirin family protein [Neosynechococcus sphagnicola]KGF73515.1 quercetin 2,3-dioxygenase [Neosynechococcus sphagnicola sy1]
MITLRPAQERGHAHHGWLDSFHTFSFASYYDPQHMGFSDLRVINEDRIAAGAGFPNHSHQDMEIVTYVLDGALEHQDSMGNRTIIRPGEVQRMSAGTGVTHSEYNPSPTDAVHLLQIWILPEQLHLQPSYEQKFYPPAEKQGQLRLIASQDGREETVTVHQDMSLYAATLAPDQAVTYEIPSDRRVWLQVVRGAVTVNQSPLQAGDGAGISKERSLQIVGQQPAEFLLFDLQ